MFVVNDSFFDLVKFRTCIIKHNTPIEMQVFLGSCEKHGNKHVLGSSVIIKTKTALLLL
jgi:hypothetical protein